MKTQLVVVTLLVAVGAFSNVNRSTNKLGMYGGNSTSIQNYPYVASIVIFDSSFCAATIVSESWVVAPMTCVNGLGPESVSIVVGSNDGLKGTKHNATKMVMHPKFSVQTNYLDYNYVCIEINGKFKWSNKVQPAKLPSKRVAVNTHLEVAGYGLTPTSSVDGSASNVLQAGVMTWQSAKDCNKTVAQADPPVRSYTGRMACAWNKGKTTLCDGDWGDALTKNGTFYAQNIAYIDDGYCTENAQPGIFADIFPVASWIKKTTGAKYEHEL